MRFVIPDCELMFVRILGSLPWGHDPPEGIYVSFASSYSLGGELPGPCWQYPFKSHLVVKLEIKASQQRLFFSHSLDKTDKFFFWFVTDVEHIFPAVHLNSLALHAFLHIFPSCVPKLYLQHSIFSLHLHFWLLVYFLYFFCELSIHLRECSLYLLWCW